MGGFLKVLRTADPQPRPRACACAGRAAETLPVNTTRRSRECLFRDEPDAAITAQGRRGQKRFLRGTTRGVSRPEGMRAFPRGVSTGGRVGSEPDEDTRGVSCRRLARRPGGRRARLWSLFCSLGGARELVVAQAVAAAAGSLFLRGASATRLRPAVLPVAVLVLVGSLPNIGQLRALLTRALAPSPLVARSGDP